MQAKADEDGNWVKKLREIFFCSYFLEEKIN